MRMAYCIPAYRGSVAIETAQTYARDRTAIVTAGVELIEGHTDVCHVEVARNTAVEQAIRSECDYLVMLDNDTYVPGSRVGLDAMMRHLHEYDGSAIGAAYRNRDGEHMTCIPARPGEVYEGDVGTGYMLLHLQRLADLPRPWFVRQMSDDGTDVNPSSDWGFCRYAREHGHRVLVDYTFPVGHAGRSHHVTEIP